jgi:hypothetical protein
LGAKRKAEGWDWRYEAYARKIGIENIRYGIVGEKIRVGGLEVRRLGDEDWRWEDKVWNCRRGD